ncbi:beta-lactamase/transpeptidase-like protein [Lentithecium fluviatile CBS 122367]|uniref:Beta-lactamase/transpeptidase-like protein n=1 Tax=Lentithecium fluviatile CBS 122367 TaxID=1168545 RepID=A0A6G1J6V6_9PLEO|nr:beta-lactamase/transpeptidase-like protein [Lentithecium fluviatile CBS 122367]
MDIVIELHPKLRSIDSHLVRQKIEERLPLFDQIRQTTKQPGLSIGLVHAGQAVCEHHFGVRDVVSQEPPNSNTLYSIASLTKGFITASIGILVAEGKTSWDSTVCSILPDFGPHAESPGLTMATLRDILSHRTGAAGLDPLVQGMHSQMTLDRENAISLVNALPVRGTFRASYAYNNALYGIAGKVIEKLAGVDSWADFVRERILQPLGMQDTTASDVDIESNNVATPYTAISDGSLFKEAPPALSGTSINGASGGLKSTTADLVKWCVAVTDAFKYGDVGKSDQERWIPNNPIKELPVISSAHNIVDPTFPSDEHYCLGWFRQTTPARLGLISPNRSQRSPILGKESLPVTIYSHQGDVPGYTCSLYVVPEAAFAIFALSNGTGLSDCTDWICQDVLQELFHLKPAVDFLQEAMLAAESYRTCFDRTLYQPFLKARQDRYQPPPTEDFLGEYVLDGCNFKVDIIRDETNDSPAMVVNERPNQLHPLQPFRLDHWTFMPKDLDEYLRRGYGLFDLVDEFVLAFHRDDDGHVRELTWRMSSVVTRFLRKT